jgi:hypothetical protein
MVDKLEQSMSQQNNTLKLSMYQAQLDSKEQYLVNADKCDGSDFKAFSSWLEQINTLTLVMNKDPELIAIATSRGALHQFVMELNHEKLPWYRMKARLQERFSEFGNKAMAKSRVTSVKQEQLPMYEYIRKYNEIVDAAYGIGPENSITQTLCSNFIDGVDNPHVRNKLRNFEASCLQELFEKAMKEDQKQKIRSIDFQNHRSSPILECDVDAIGHGNCFKCGGPGHLAAQCSKPSQCFNCGKPGHFSKECTEPRKPRAKPQDDTQPDSPAPKADDESTNSKLLEAMYTLIKALKYSKPEYQSKPRSYYNNGQNGGKQYHNNNNKYSHNKRPFTKVNEVGEADLDDEDEGNSSENEDQTEADSSSKN